MGGYDKQQGSPDHGKNAQPTWQGDDHPMPPPPSKPGDINTAGATSSSAASAGASSEANVGLNYHPSFDGSQTSTQSQTQTFSPQNNTRLSSTISPTQITDAGGGAGGAGGLGGSVTDLSKTNLFNWSLMNGPSVIPSCARSFTTSVPIFGHSETMPDKDCRTDYINQADREMAARSEIASQALQADVARAQLEANVASERNDVAAHVSDCEEAQRVGSSAGSSYKSALQIYKDGGKDAVSAQMATSTATVGAAEAAAAVTLLKRCVPEGVVDGSAIVFKAAAAVRVHEQAASPKPQPPVVADKPCLPCTAEVARAAAAGAAEGTARALTPHQ